MSHSQHRFDLANHPPSETIKMLTGLLERITKTNDQLQASSTEKRSAYTCFHARSIPSIDIHSYLARILKYCPCTNECFLGLLVYFDRMSRKSSGLRIDSFNIHRLVISGIMVASKFFSDIFFTNTRYAKVGGLPIAELNALELEFLHLNDFNLTVPLEELQQYGDQLLLHWVREEERNKELEWRRKAPRFLTQEIGSGSRPASAITSEDSQRHRRVMTNKDDPYFRIASTKNTHVEQRNHRRHTPTNGHKEDIHSPKHLTRNLEYPFAPSHSMGNTSNQKQLPPHSHRHSWHTDHHRLPTPPYRFIQP